MNSTALKSPLPLSALLAMAMTGFIGIMTETLPAGLLPQIPAGLDISQAMAGQLITLYASGSLMAVMTSGWNRRTALLTTTLGFLVFNTITTVSTNFMLTLFARWMAGAAAGLAWGLLAGYARRMVPRDGRYRWRCRLAYRWGYGWAPCPACGRRSGSCPPSRCCWWYG